MKRFAFIVTLSLLLAACGESKSPAPVSVYGASYGVGTTGVHIVNPGDTLWSISNRYKIGMRDIVLANKIRAPFTLFPAQRIQLPPPLEYRVREGDTLYHVAQINNVSISQIARLNNLYAPYNIFPGQVLRLPSATYQPKRTARPATKPVTESAAIPSAPQKPVQIASAKPQPISRGPVSTRPPPRAGSKFKPPIRGQIVSRFGTKPGGIHNDGINIAAPRGTAVAAADNGVVVYAGSELKGSGNLILLRHGDGYLTAYAHLDEISAVRGAVVKQGQTIGSVGSTGSVSTPQLHFEVRKGTRALDPAKYLSL